MDEKSHVDPEAEYFAREDREKKAALAAKIEAENAAKARAERKVLHAGACGKCGGAMKPQDFRGVEIDVCEDCGSVLLDPGELQTLAGNDQSGVIGSLASFFSFRR